MDKAYACYLLLGCGTLFPWNAFITAADYYNSVWPDKHTDRLITVCYLPVNLITLLFMVRFNGIIRPKVRIAGGLLLFTICVSLMPVLNLIDSSSLLAGVLILVAVCGFADGIAQGSLFGEAARLPSPKYTQALCAGTAISGVTVSILRIITKAAVPNTSEGLRRSASLYFAIAALVCLSCLIVYMAVLPRLSIIKALRQQDLRVALDEDYGTEKNMHSIQHHSAVAVNNGDTDQASGSGSSSNNHGIGIGSTEQEGGLLGSDTELSYGLRTSAAAPLVPTVRQTFPLIKDLALALAFVYIITLSIFPGVLAEDLSSEELGSWYPVILIAIFNVFDWIGKSIPAIPGLYGYVEGSTLVVMALSRVVFIPAFYFAAVYAGSYIVGFLVVILAISNGWLTSILMMQAPPRVSPAAGPLCGNIMVLALVFGLCIGAMCGFLWLL